MTLDNVRITNPIVEADDLRDRELELSSGSAIPVLGFGTLIPDPIATRNATRAALETGFRALDTAERYRTEPEVGEAMKDAFKSGKIRREDCSSPRNCGTPIIDPSASNRLSKPASKSSNSTIWTF